MSVSYQKNENYTKNVNLFSTTYDDHMFFVMIKNSVTLIAYIILLTITWPVVGDLY